MTENPPGSAATVERWYITTAFFEHGGKVYAGWGPFESRELALRVRALVERAQRREDLCVDSRREAVDAT